MFGAKLGPDKISVMTPHVGTTKRLAAQRQIDAAIAHFFKKELECAITLAAAAESLLPDTEQPHIYRYLREHSAYNDKEIDFNKTINWHETCRRAEDHSNF